MRALRIATRKSPLALWQAHHVASLIRTRRPECEVTLLELSTAGDRFLQVPLSAIGGKGLFVKEIEQALLEGTADVAVHSLKDLTSEMPERLMLAACPEREDPRDAFVGRHAPRLADLPAGTKVGTSSLRRTCQLLAQRPDLEVVPLRGNVQTRLARMEEHDLGGAILAAAGLLRLELAGRISELLPPEVSLPAVGQGVLALQCRVDDEEVRAVLGELDHAPTRARVRAERAFLAELEGGCTVPLAGYATLEDGALHLRGLVGRPDGSEIVRGERRGPPERAAELGVELGRELLGRGGAEILRAFAASNLPRVPES